MSKTAKQQIKDLLDNKEKDHLLERLDEVDNELTNLNHKRYELEQRQKYLLNKINEIDLRSSEVVNKLDDFGFKKEVISEGITAFTLDSKTFR